MVNDIKFNIFGNLHIRVMTGPEFFWIKAFGVSFFILVEHKW
jgi:hypothetical protein